VSLMTDDDLAAAVDAAAAAYGLDLTEEEREGHALEAEMTTELLADLEPTTFESEPATDVEPGADEYNAFLYRYDYPGADAGPLDGLEVASRIISRSPACR